jgi:hypothetical protein
MNQLRAQMVAEALSSQWSVMDYLQQQMSWLWFHRAAAAAGQAPGWRSCD